MWSPGRTWLLLTLLDKTPTIIFPGAKPALLLAIFATRKTSWERPFFFLSFKTNKLIQSQTNLSKKSQDPSSIPARETYRENDPIALKDYNCANSLLENTQFFCTSVCATNFSCFALISAVAFPRLHASMQHPSSRNPTRGARPQHAGAGSSPCRSPVGRVCWFHYILRVRVYGVRKNRFE